MKVTIYFLTKNTRFLCQRKIMPYPCQYFCMRVCPILTILKNWIFVSKEFSKNGKKEITWHVDKLDFDEIGPTQPSFRTLPDFLITQMNWVSRRQFHTRFQQSSTIFFLPVFRQPFWTNQTSRITTACIYCLIITRDFQRRTKRLNFDWKSSSFSNHQKRIKQHEIINLIDFNFDTLLFHLLSHPTTKLINKLIKLIN